MILRSQPWSYSPNGWEKFFLPVTHCKYEDIANTSIPYYPPSDDLANHRAVIYPLYVKPMPKWLPFAMPADLVPLVEPLHEDPELWWVGQVLLYLFRLQPRVAAQLEDEYRKENFQTPSVG